MTNFKRRGSLGIKQTEHSLVEPNFRQYCDQYEMGIINKQLFIYRGILYAHMRRSIDYFMTGRGVLEMKYWLLIGRTQFSTNERPVCVGHQCAYILHFKLKKEERFDDKADGILASHWSNQIFDQ